MVAAVVVVTVWAMSVPRCVQFPAVRSRNRPVYAMILIYLLFAVWLMFGAYFAWWAIAMTKQWRAVESYSYMFRVRMFLTSSERWMHEVAEMDRDLVANFVKGLRWRYLVFFFVVPGTIFAAVWFYV